MGKNIKARRKLSELFATGVELRFSSDGVTTGPFEDPAGEEEVALWVSPPSPLQREMALREAQAARARSLIRTKQDDNSEEYLTAKAYLAQLSHDGLVDYVLMVDGQSRRDEAVRDVLSDEEWKDITSLQDAMRQFYESGADEDDPEFAPLLEADKRYGDQVEKRLEELTAAARDAFAFLSREDLEKKGMDRRSEIAVSQVFMSHYERHMLFYSARDIADHKVMFFENPNDLADESEVVQQAIKDAVQVFITDGAEAKNSPRAESGSDSSAPPSEQATSEVSTPEEPTG